MARVSKVAENSCCYVSVPSTVVLVGNKQTKRRNRVHGLSLGNKRMAQFVQAKASGKLRNFLVGESTVTPPSSWYTTNIKYCVKKGWEKSWEV